MKILILDNYDSFTYNIVHLLRELGVVDLKVVRNDQLPVEKAADYDKILLSPGPGIPFEAGNMPELVKRYAASKSILGVCLGHQCIGEVFGAKLINMDHPAHGIATDISIVKPEEKIFRGLPATFKAGRYHSWLVAKDNLPECLEITAADAAGQLMALTHKEFDVRGIQFHPESVLTEHGRKILQNWLS